MKKYRFLVLVCILALSSASTAQSVVVTPKKIVYSRPRPMSEYKKTFTVTYPKIKAATPALSKKIETTISFFKLLQLNVREELREVQWLEEADYEVMYNARGILVIVLRMEGSGAYPDGTAKTVVVNLKTGNRITPTEAFTNVDGLVAAIDEKQKREIERTIKELRENPEEKNSDPSELFGEKKFTTKNLEEFALDDSGVTFIYEYGFPHVIQALEPEGRYKFSWREIARFINPAGPFGKFISK